VTCPFVYHNLTVGRPARAQGKVFGVPVPDKPGLALLGRTVSTGYASPCNPEA